MHVFTRTKWACQDTCTQRADYGTRQARLQWRPSVRLIAVDLLEKSQNTVGVGNKFIIKISARSNNKRVFAADCNKSFKHSPQPGP